MHFTSYNNIDIPDKGALICLYEHADIQETIKSIADNLNNKINSTEDVVVIGVLKACYRFVADLTANFLFNHQLDFITPSREAASSTTLKTTLEGRTVILVDTIIDTGDTFSKLSTELAGMHPRQIYNVALINKYNARKPEHKGIVLEDEPLQVPNNFVVGYGLDYEQRYRQLNGFYLLINTLK